MEYEEKAAAPKRIGRRSIFECDRLMAYKPRQTKSEVMKNKKNLHSVCVKRRRRRKLKQKPIACLLALL